MDTKEFMAYVMDCKRQGLDDGQIAKKLGMDILDFEMECQAAFDGATIPVVKEVKKKVEDVKPVSGAGVKVEQPERKEKVDGIFFVPQNEEKFMNEPIIKSSSETEVESAG